MSWHISLTIGPKPNVIAIVEDCPTLPAALKCAIVETIRDSEGDMARVETYGHSGGGFSSIGKLEVSGITSAPAPVAVPEPPATAAQVPESLKSTTTQA